MAYLLDANVFMSAKQLHYGFDFCPAFWDWLVAKNSSGQVFSIEKVNDEIKAGSDELSDWAAARGPNFFLKPNPAMVPFFGQVSEWVTSQVYTLAAVNTFLQVADYYLVTHALAQGHTIVTHEIAENTTNRVKIPNDCIGLGVKSMTPFEMLRTERARFVLGPLK